MEGWDALNHGSPAGVASLREAVRKYPDDPEAWFLLAETYIHVGGSTYGSEDDIWEALDRATTLDPNFAPYMVHVAEFAVLRGDRPRAEETLARYEALTGGPGDNGHIRLAIRLLLGDEREVAAAIAGLANESERTLDIYGGTFGQAHDHFDRDAAVDAAMAAKQEVNRTAFQGYYAGGRGEVARASGIMADPAVSASNRAIYWAFVNELWNVQPPAPGGPAGTITPAACDEPANTFCHMHVGIASARLGRWSDAARSQARLREEAAIAPDSTIAGRRLEMAEVIEGSVAWRRGDLARGRELLLRNTGAVVAGERARMELGWLELEAGRPAEAARQFRSVLRSFARAHSLYGLATALEQQGQREEAREYWARLATLTEVADDMPRVAEAREALVRLAGEAGSRR